MSDLDPIPRQVGPEDDGRTFSMTIGDPASLVVPDPAAADPVVQGDSVELVEVLNVVASGVREWELQAVRPGRTVVSSREHPSYSITIEVLSTG